MYYHHSCRVLTLRQVALDDGQKMGALLVGLEKISKLMGRCLSYESLYLTSWGGGFKETIVELYARILPYLIRVGQSYTKNIAGELNCGLMRWGHTDVFF